MNNKDRIKIIKDSIKWLTTMSSSANHSNLLLKENAKHIEEYLKNLKIVKNIKFYKYQEKKFTVCYLLPNRKRHWFMNFKFVDKF